jgi:hypothetical protein
MTFFPLLLVIEVALDHLTDLGCSANMMTFGVEVDTPGSEPGGQGALPWRSILR